MSLTFKPGQKFHHAGTGALLVVVALWGRGRNRGVIMRLFDADHPKGITLNETARTWTYRITRQHFWSYVGPHCRECGCVQVDCRRCIARTGEPCSWIEPDLCSACAAACENIPKRPSAGAKP